MADKDKRFGDQVSLQIEDMAQGRRDGTTSLNSETPHPRIVTKQSVPPKPSPKPK